MMEESKDYSNIEIEADQMESENFQSQINEGELESIESDITFLQLSNDTKSNTTSIIQITDDADDQSNNNGTFSKEIVTTTTWVMLATDDYPCKFVKKQKGNYLYSCFFKEETSGTIKAMIVPSDSKRNKYWQVKQVFVHKISKEEPKVVRKPKIHENRTHLWDLFHFPVIKSKKIKETKVKGAKLGVKKEVENIFVEGKQMNKKQFSTWLKTQNPHHSQLYWTAVHEFRFGPDMTDEQALCYS